MTMNIYYEKVNMKDNLTNVSLEFSAETLVWDEGIQIFYFDILLHVRIF